MEKKDYTPTKGSHLLNASSIYGASGREASKFAGEMSLVREYEALKLQAKQLEIVNKQLAAEAEKLRY